MSVSTQFGFVHTYKKDENVLFHSHNTYEIVYYVSGEGTTKIGDKTYKYKPNSLAFLYPHTIHNELHTSSTKVICFGFNLSSIPEELTEGVFFNLHDFPEILTFAQIAASEFSAQKKYYKKLTDMSVYQVLLTLSRANNNSFSHSMNIEYVINYIDEYFTSEIDNKLLAKMCNYSYDHFRHMFKKETGYSPKQYILKKRISHASGLLTGSKLSITDIAINSGFSSISQFSSIFKKNTGLSPNKYRSIS